MNKLMWGLASVLAVLVVAPLRAQAPQLSDEEAFLRFVPDDVTIAAKVKGSDKTDTSARQHATRRCLGEMIKRVSQGRASTDAATPAERAAMKKLQSTKAFQPPPTPAEVQQTHEDPNRWERLLVQYAADPSFRDEVLLYFDANARMYYNGLLEKEKAAEAAAAAALAAADKAREVETHPPPRRWPGLVPLGLAFGVAYQTGRRNWYADPARSFEAEVGRRAGNLVRWLFILVLIIIAMGIFIVGM